MTTATKSKPVIRKDDPKPAAKKAKKSKFTPWTDEQVKILTDAVADAPTISAGIKAAAKALGKKEGAVQQKYYSMKRAAAPTRKPKAARRGRPPVKKAAPKVGMAEWIEARIAGFDQQISQLKSQRDALSTTLLSYKRSR